MSKTFQFTDSQLNFIRRAPFLLLASASAKRGTDISPRGDGAGFVQISGTNTLLLPDRIGNNRLDTLSNLLDNPAVSLMFLVPDCHQILLTFGTAIISCDPELTQRFIHNGKPPKTVLVVKTHEAHLSASQSIGASHCWKSSAQPPKVPTLGDMLADQIEGISKQYANEFVAESYKNRLY